MQVFMVRKEAIFYGEELLAPRPTPKLGNHSLSALRECLFNIFAATLHTGMGARGGVVAKALRYKPAGRGFDSRWCHWNFSVT